MVADTSKYDPTPLREAPLTKKRRMSNGARMVVAIAVGPEEKIYYYEPKTIVNRSGFLRNELLASLMNPRRKDSMLLYLPHVSPSDWELMMKHADPTCEQTLSVDDAARLRIHFKRYGFEQGAKRCDDVLKNQRADHKNARAA